MAEEVKIEDIAVAIKELRDVLDTVDEKHKTYDEKINALNGMDKEKVEKLEKFIDEQEELNQKKVEAEEKAKADEAELKERIVNLEGQIVRKAEAGEIDIKEVPEFKAFNALLKAGSFAGVAEEHKDYLRTDQGEFGGFLVPEIISSDLRKKIEEISGVRALSRVRSINAKTLNIAIRDKIPTANYEGEAEAASKSNSKYTNQTMTAHRQHVIIPVTRDMLNFSQFDMQSEITQDAATAFAKSEGNKFLLGTGVKQPEGILTRSDIETVTTATSGTVTLDEVIELAGKLKEGYNPVYAFNRSTLYNLRTQKDSSGNYLWQIGGTSMPTQLNGYNYKIMQDMPDIASNSLSVLFGDFFNGYTILDSLQMELVRDDVTRKSEAIVEFSWNRYNDGRVVLAEAFKLLKTKA